ncbi:MAG: N-acetyl-gamma-glutamyl-phosphate reductase [Verrucomicrobiota bacterium]
MRVAIVGASGYTGEELINTCLRHPGIQLAKITSRQYAGARLGDFLGINGDGADLVFENLTPEQVAQEADVVFLSLPHGVASEYVVPLLEKQKIVFDLSADFRLKDAAVYKEFYQRDHPAPQLLKESVYGLPELYADEIKKARLIACPGCYPTSVILALAPALREKLIDPAQIVVTAMSGVSGAGKKLDNAYLFCECNENLRAYSIPKHRHLSEMEQELSALAGERIRISFTPHLVPVNRGILTTISASCVDKTDDVILSSYQKFYEKSLFVRVLNSSRLPETRRVLKTNFAEIACRLDTRTNRLMIICAIDNLGKGAASQAMQAFNIRFGLPEDEGLT